MSPPKSSLSSPGAWIALVGLPLSGIHAEVLRGIQQSAHAKGWTLFYVDRKERFSEIEMNTTFFKGCIALVADDDTADRLAKLPFPVINVSNTYPEKYGFPSVLPDDRAIGRRAADWFLERGYLHFALHIPPALHDYGYIQNRGRGFMDRIHETGQEVLLLEDVYSEEEKARALEPGLQFCRFRDLPRPCGLFCSDDTLASYMCFTARAFGCRVPEDLAVMGVDNVELFCEMNIPPLTSIDIRPRDLGLAASALLEKQMSRPWQSRLPYEIHPILPGNVVVRTSANEVAIHDPQLAKARQIILNQACKGINVADVVEGVDLSRRALELRYQRTFDETMLQTLNRVRTEQAVVLIQTTDLLLQQIARRCGFRDAHQMTRVFLRLKMKKPSEWRKKNRESS